MTGTVPAAPPRLDLAQTLQQQRDRLAADLATNEAVLSQCVLLLDSLGYLLDHAQLLHGPDAAIPVTALRQVLTAEPQPPHRPDRGCPHCGAAPDAYCAPDCANPCPARPPGPQDTTGVQWQALWPSAPSPVHGPSPDLDALDGLLGQIETTAPDTAEHVNAVREVLFPLLSEIRSRQLHGALDLSRIYEAHRDAHHNGHTCPDTPWVHCLLEAIQAEAVAYQRTMAALHDALEVHEASARPGPAAIEVEQVAAAMRIPMPR